MIGEFGADSTSMTMVPTQRALAHPHADMPSLLDLASEVVVIAGSLPVAEVDRMFRRDPDLQAVVVSRGETYALLSRDQVQRKLDGRLGYGRALHTRARVDALLPSHDFALPGHLLLVDAAQRILDRPLRHRYHDVLVLTEAGPRVIPVSQIFERMWTIYHHVALHDPLTGLPNRRLLEQHGAMLVGSTTALDQIAILYIDLDGFKAVNDTFGHRVGDDILIAFSERLRTCVRPGDVVARLGGDEFAALLVGTTETQATVIADRVVLTATAPFLHEDQMVCVSATVGVAMASDITHETELTQLDVLLRHADGAMLNAKNAGKRRVGRLDSRTSAAPFARHGQIRRRMREALTTGDFTLHYQPKLDLFSGDVTQVEALIRWDDAELGSVSPVEFIPIAEAGEEIHLLGQWVIDEACRQARRWLDARTPHAIAVNVSPKQFTTGHLVHDVIDALARWDVPASMLRIEITEGSAIVDVPGAVEQLDVLQAAGIQVDLDDFGTGYSSLTMLHVLPLNAVKIDRTFIDCVDRSNADALMIGGVIDAAHALGLTVIAEGVERQEQLDVLRQLGCDEAQGYFISRPVTARALDRLTITVDESG